jgi:hypothetical protein
MTRVRYSVALLLIFAFAGCATQDDVRAACAAHGGVRAVSGNTVRKYVTCIDGHYRTVR